VPFVSPVSVQPAGVALLQVVPPGLAVAEYPVTAVPPSLTGAVQVAASWPSPAVSTTAVGAPGTPVQKLPDVVEVDDVQFPSLAFTTGVTWALVVRSMVSPATPVARVLTPSLTSYVSPAGAPGAADAVQVTRHVVGPTREALTLAGAYADSDPLDSGREPADAEVVNAAQTTPPEMPSAQRAPNDSTRERRRRARRRSTRRPPSAFRDAAPGVR
jgi:hypothetical protein